MKLTLSELHAERNRVSEGGWLKQIPKPNHWGFGFSLSKQSNIVCQVP